MHTTLARISIARPDGTGSFCKPRISSTMSFEPKPLTASEIINTPWLPISPAATFEGNGKQLRWKDAIGITSTSEQHKKTMWPNNLSGKSDLAVGESVYIVGGQAHQEKT